MLSCLSLPPPLPPFSLCFSLSVWLSGHGAARCCDADGSRSVPTTDSAAHFSPSGYSRWSSSHAHTFLITVNSYLWMYSFISSFQGAVLSVTYTVAAATGITYLQYTDVDSGRNIFNTGFTVFMSLVLPRWFRMQSGFIYTGRMKTLKCSLTGKQGHFIIVDGVHSFCFLIFLHLGVRSLDIFLQSCLMLPVFLVSLLAFLLDHTVSGTKHTH